MADVGSIMHCRVCFRETGGHRQCRGSNYSCSGWSNEQPPQWTEEFHDIGNAGSTSAGCVYQWSFQCESSDLFNETTNTTTTTSPTVSGSPFDAMLNITTTKTTPSGSTSKSDEMSNTTTTTSPTVSRSPSDAMLNITTTTTIPMESTNGSDDMSNTTTMTATGTFATKSDGMPVTTITMSPAEFTAHSYGMFNTTTTMSTAALSASTMSTSPTDGVSNTTTTTSTKGESTSLFDGIAAKTWTATTDVRGDANDVCGLMSKVKNLQLHLQFLTYKLGKLYFCIYFL